MRLTEYQRDCIVENSKAYFGSNSKVYLFGSRTDDNRRGGDIDLFIECEDKYNSLASEIEFLIKLQQNIGQQKIDIIRKSFNIDDDRLIAQQALKKGILL